MSRSMTKRLLVAGLVLALVASACGGRSSKSSKKGKSGAPGKTIGFDGTTITLGVLTPQTGVAAIIGNPLTAGNQVYFQQLNDKGGIAGKYKVNLLIKDTKYTTQDTSAQYAATKNQVVMYNQILGTPPVNAILPELKADNIVAQPATLDAPWYSEPNLMPILAPYQVQVANSFDYYVNHMEGKGKKICTITSTDPYGEAGLQGAKFAAEKLGTTLTDSEQFTAGAPNPDFTAQIDSLKNKGCEMVWVTALPPDLGSILGRAAQVNYTPQWIGQSPTWVSALLSTSLKDYLEQHFILASEGVPWDSSAPGMVELRNAIQKYKPDQKPDIYFVFGWMEAKAVSQLLEKAVANGDLSRDGIRKAMKDVGTLDFGGIVSPEAYGDPAQRKPQRETTLFKPTAASLDSNGGLTPLAPDAINYTSAIGKDVPLK